LEYIERETTFDVSYDDHAVVGVSGKGYSFIKGMWFKNLDVFHLKAELLIRVVDNLNDFFLLI
jgi:hypothetical protein